MANKTKNLDLIKDVFLHDNETIIYAIFGAYKTKSLGKDTIWHGVLAATDERIIFCAKRLSGYDSEIFHYSKISTFELSKILMWNTISFYSSGNKVSMKWVNDKDLDKFIEFVNKNVEGSNNSLGLIDQATHSDNDLQPLEKIKKLKELLDMDAITQEEFDKKKQQLLNS